MEDKKMERELLNDEVVEDAVGGNFNWWRKADGTRMCLVDNVGKFVCSADAKDAFAWLKAEHRYDGWTEEQYVEALLATGDFIPA